MYPNVRAEMARRNITMDMLAFELGKTKSTTCQKLNGKAPLSLAEAEVIRDYLNPNMTIDEMFDRA